MTETIRKHITLIVTLFVAWFGYSELDVEGGAQVAKAKYGGVVASVFEMREEGAWIRLIRDPTGLIENVPVETVLVDLPLNEPDALGGGGQAAVDPGRTGPQTPMVRYVSPNPHMVAAAWIGGLGQAAGSVLEELRNWGRDAEQPATVGAGSSAPAAAVAPQVPFTLQLESTLLIPGAFQARITGKTVRVGEPIPGLDPDSPPLLSEVSGSSVVITHRSKTYQLELDGHSIEYVGAPPQAAPEISSIPALLGIPVPGAPPKPAKTSNKSGSRRRGKMGGM